MDARTLPINENLSDVVFSLDLDGRVLYVNRGVLLLLGYQQKDVLNRPFVELLSSDEARKEFLEFITQAHLRINFRKAVTLQNSMGVGQDFDVNLTLLEEALIYGVARKLDSEKLKFFAVYASITSRYGNRGQSDYAAANEALNVSSDHAISVKGIAELSTPTIRNSRQRASRSASCISAKAGWTTR